MKKNSKMLKNNFNVKLRKIKSSKKDSPLMLRKKQQFKRNLHKFKRNLKHYNKNLILSVKNNNF